MTNRGIFQAARFHRKSFMWTPWVIWSLASRCIWRDQLLPEIVHEPHFSIISPEKAWIVTAKWTDEDMASSPYEPTTLYLQPLPVEVPTLCLYTSTVFLDSVTRVGTQVLWNLDCIIWVVLFPKKSYNSINAKLSMKMNIYLEGEKKYQ